MNLPERLLLSGNEAIALAAHGAKVALGTGYPGTPSTEILESLAALGGPAQWAPNEKVALEVGLGVAFAGARALVTMKHVGLNVAADPLFTAAYTGARGALVVVSADDPGMASSQNEQDNRRYAVAAGLPMLEPSDSQEAYDFTLTAIELAELFQIPVLLRLTTRVCHGKTVVRPTKTIGAPAAPGFARDIRRYVMVPAYARAAHRKLRQKLVDIAAWNEQSTLSAVVDGDKKVGIVASGVAYTHVREAAPTASFLKIGMTYPLPLGRIRAFAAKVSELWVIEEGDPYLAESLRAAGIAVTEKAEMYRFGELTVGRVRRILSGDTTPEDQTTPGKAPELCPGCPYRTVFDVLKQGDTVVAGDIGCYTLGSLPPFEAMDTCISMGASIGVGLGLRRVLPDKEARRVISVIGDSTFIHSGITGIAEMVYNPPETGHVVVILDNGTTAMTGMQEHPGTGRTLGHEKTGKVVIEDLVRAMGVKHVYVIDPVTERKTLETTLKKALDEKEIAVFILRRTCVLAAGSIKKYERAGAPDCGVSDE
jgi:indolepyruvate ferredoxin oxidoreductase, alpha subunit